MMRLALLVLLGLLAYAWWDTRPAPPTHLEVADVLGGDAAGFAPVRKGYVLEFPRDYGAHRDFRSEWWYVTGNLGAAGGPGGTRSAPLDQGYGYQFTIFRQSLESPLAALPLPRQSAWATRSAYMGHLATSDIAAGKFQHTERFSREAMGMAGCTASPFKVWLGDWSLERQGADFRLHTEELDLTLTPSKPEVLQGDQGYSQKGPEPEQASYYYSLPRLRTRGRLKGVAVEGSSWFDREWSSRSLPKGLNGWDWFSLQFDDNQEFMFYQLRRADGQPTEQSAGTWINANGHDTHLSSRQVRLEPKRYFTSTVDGTRYPIAWTLQVEGHAPIEVEARLDDQEWTGSFRYWEGAVKAQCGAVAGKGYLELTGYQFDKKP